MLKFAVRNLLSRPLRSLLSLLGLTVAIAGMVGLFSVAAGLRQVVGETFERIPGLVVMQPNAPIPLFSSLPASWGPEIAALPGVRTVDAQVCQRINTIDHERILSPPRFLVGMDIPARLKLKVDVYRDTLQSGRFLTLDDRGTLNCVISRPIADEFKKKAGDPIEVNGRTLNVVGVYFIDSLLLDMAILMDIDEVRAITRFDASSVSNFYVETDDTHGQDEVTESIRRHFVGREVEPWQPSLLLAAADQRNPVSGFFTDVDRWIKSGGNRKPPPSAAPTSPEAHPPRATMSGGLKRMPESPIEVRRSEDWAEQFDHFSEDLNVILFALTAIGLTIAVLSIINTMVMSVTERIIEIGILKANGWSKTDVLKLISTESALLGLGGGLVGALAGWTGTQAVNWYFPERASLYASPGLLAFSVVFSTALGMLGGLYPAFWAMRMMPMDAIRRG